MTDRILEGELIPISLVAHEVFCPRRAWLEAAGETVESLAIAVGTAHHRRVDDPRSSDAATIRALEVRDPDLGVVGRCDAVRREPDGALTIVEHKATPVRKKPRVTEPMRIQLALQGLALQAQGQAVAGYEVRFTSHNVTRVVDICADDQVAAIAAISATRETVTSSRAPEPLEDDPRCLGCSHAGVCLPDERALRKISRKIVVSDPDSEVLHLASPGSRAFLRQGRIVVSRRDEEPASVPIERVQAIIVHGNTDLSAALLREAFWQAIPVVWCSGTGRVMGWASSARSPNGHQRVRQHEMAAHGRLDIAKEFVYAKICNQATLLRRNGSVPAMVHGMRTLQKSVMTTDSLEALLGVEGEAASVYFAGFASMLKVPWVTFHRRLGRGATDPVNVALNIAYGVLLAECIRAIAACGLDPHAGFLHSPSRNKPALALDLCEEFRPTVADSAVLRALNNGELSGKDFTQVLGTTRIRDGGRRAVVAAMQRRLGAHFNHPTFGYDVTWRRAIEVQARMILGVIDGTQPHYKGVRVR